MIQITTATPNDLIALTAISRETFIDNYEHLNDPLHFWEYVESAFTEEKLLEEMQSPDTRFFLAYYDGMLAGYAKVNMHRSAPGAAEHAQQIELERIYVQRLYQGMHIGKALLDEALRIGRTYDCTFIWLGVWQRNAKAIAWYEQQGFRKFGVQHFHMGQDVQDDWLMGREA